MVKEKENVMDNDFGLQKEKKERKILLFIV